MNGTLACPIPMVFSFEGKTTMRNEVTKAKRKFAETLYYYQSLEGKKKQQIKKKSSLLTFSITLITEGIKKWYAAHVFKKTGQANELLSTRTFNDAVTYWLSQNSASKKQQTYEMKKQKKNKKD